MPVDLEPRPIAVAMRLGGSVVVALAFALMFAGCPKHLDDRICAVDARWLIAEPSNIPPTPPTEPELAERLSVCKAKLDAAKPGPVECTARCYEAATSREALFDCDRRCGIVLQW